jgi:hypothetical protein
LVPSSEIAKDLDLDNLDTALEVLFAMGGIAVTKKLLEIHTGAGILIIITGGRVNGGNLQML